MHDIAVVIPSLHPEAELLLPFLADLRQAGFTRLVVVDDGSGPDYADVFATAEREHGATVLRHDVNQGKGRALKTAFAHCATLEGLTGVVTADSDGQHAPDDIARVAAAVEAAPPTSAVFGVRDFTGSHVPPNSRRGNHITSKVVQVLFGQYLSDTQTGLRGFPLDLALQTAHVKGERFEYEMNVVLWLMGNHHPIIEVPIATIYHDIENSVSHFRPVRDSARIYGVILRQSGRFVLSSLAGSAIDLGVYALLVDLVFGGRAQASSVVTATIGARVVSSLANFAINRNAVFADSSSPRRALIRYYVLAAGLLGASALGTTLLSRAFGGHLVWAKILIDGVLFVASFLIQKRWVFSDNSLAERH